MSGANVTIKMFILHCAFCIVHYKRVDACYGRCVVYRMFVFDPGR